MRLFSILEGIMEFKEDIRRFNEKHKMNTVKIGGGDFNYVLSGSGEKKIVLFTAGSGLYEGFYRHIQLLEEKYTVVAFDYPEGKKDIYHLVDSIAEFLKSINFNKSYFIGESLGGLVVELFMKKYPKMIEGVVLTNTGTITKNIPNTMRKEVVDGIKSAIKTVQMTPAYILKSALIKKSLKKIKEDFDGSIDSIYAKEYVGYLMERVSKEKAIYLCSIALDFAENITFDKNDFKDFDGSICIINTNDDEVFDERIKAELKRLFENNISKTIKSGGNASFLFKPVEYVKMLEDMII